MWSDIFPPTLDVEKRNTRLMKVLGPVFSQERSRSAFLSLISRRAVAAKNFALFIQVLMSLSNTKVCIQYNGGVMDAQEEEISRNLHHVISRLAVNFPDSKRTEACFWKFAKLNDRRCYSLLKAISDPNSDYRTVLKANV